jgi:hypothetical protein
MDKVVCETSDQPQVEGQGAGVAPEKIATLELKTYNVLFYEPECIRPELRIAKAVLATVESQANSMFRRAIMPELARLGRIPGQMSLAEFAAGAHELIEPLAAKMSIPEEEQFVFNSAPYKGLGGVPGNPAEFARAHAAMTSGSIAVTFFNTAGKGEPDDYQRLARIVGESQAIFDSTWVVTSSLRERIPEAFRALIARRAGGANPAGSAARRLAITTGSPCYVPIGDSIVMRAADDASEVIHERLKFLRKFGPEKVTGQG